MTTTATLATPERLNFMGGIVTVHLAQAANADGASWLEHDLPEGFSPPLHVHGDEAETFYVLEGAFRFQAGTQVQEVRAGDAIHVPAGVPHSFRVLSAPGGRCLTMTHGRFEAMVREMSSPARVDERPELRMPGAEQQAMLANSCMRHGISLLGAPLAA